MTNQKQGVSALGLQRALGVGSYRTAWLMCHKLRAAMVRLDREPLNGTVEVDETYLGSHGGRKQVVVIAAERRGVATGRIRARRLPNIAQESLCGFVQQSVAKGSTVITDGWQAYYELKNLGYQHIPLKSPPHRQITAENDVVPHVHRVASLLKRWIVGIHHGSVSGRYLDQYLEEFAFRFNRRTSRLRGLLFYRLISNCVRVPPLSQRRLKLKHKELGLGD